MIVETLSFRLAADADETAFLAADRRVQTEFAYRQPGLLRRTAARSTGDSREWLVVDLWESLAAAEACDAAWRDDPAAAAFMSFVDASSVRWARYETLDWITAGRA